ARLGAQRRAPHRRGPGAPPMTAAPTLVPDPSTAPDAGVPTPGCGASPSAGGTAVFHVERLPLGGWGLESPLGRRRQLGVTRLPGAGAGGPARPAARAPASH